MLAFRAVLVACTTALAICLRVPSFPEYFRFPSTSVFLSRMASCDAFANAFAKKSPLMAAYDGFAKALSEKGYLMAA